MQVSLWNVALQTVNFLVLAWLLNRFLFKPVRAVLAKRQETIDASMRLGESKRADAEHLAEEYRAKSAAVAEEFDRAREQALAAADVEGRRIHEEATRQAQAEMDRAKAAVERERTEALRSLEVRAVDLATSIAERLLREVRPDSDAPFLWRAIEHVEALDAAAKVALTQRMAGARVELVSSRALDAVTRERFEQWLSGLANQSITPSYRIDESLIAGVELRLPEGVWRSHWRASIERVRAELDVHAAAA